MAYPTDNNVIADADPEEKLSNMHGGIGHSSGTNAIIAKLHAVAAKLGIGTNVASANTVLRGIGIEATDFGKVLASYMAGAGAGDANKVLATVAGTTVAMQKVVAAMMNGGGAGDANKVFATVDGTTALMSKIINAMVSDTAAISIDKTVAAGVGFRKLTAQSTPAHPTVAVPIQWTTSDQYTVPEFKPAGTATMHSMTTNNSRIYAPIKGILEMKYAIGYHVAASAVPIAQVQKNASPTGIINVQTTGIPYANDPTYSGLMGIAQVQVAAGDYVELLAKHFAGSPQDIGDYVAGTYLMVNIIGGTP